MKVNAIVVGLDHWEDYTKPCLESIRRTNQDFIVTCVDNGSNPPYPTIPGVSYVISKRKRSYAAGINLGLEWGEPADWYIILNNDIVFSQNLYCHFAGLDHNKLYGFKKWAKGTAGMPTEYLAGWGLLLSNQVYQTLGDFDEKCAPMWFEDADYCIRALKSGIELVELDREAWGIRHLEDERMDERVAYMKRNKDARNAIREYVRGKHGY